MNLKYAKCGDYLVPNLIANVEPEGVDEWLKAGEQMIWEWRMNGIWVRAEEKVLKEMILNL